jgi:hypothetical protein
MLSATSFQPLATPTLSQPKASPPTFGDVILTIPYQRGETADQQTAPQRVSTLAQGVIAQLNEVANQPAPKGATAYRLSPPTVRHETNQSIWQFSTNKNYSAEYTLVENTLLGIESKTKLPTDQFKLTAVNNEVTL